MARTLDRPEVHPEVHPDIHPDIHPDVDEFISKTLEGETITEQPRRPIRWMRWLAAALFLMAAAGVAWIVVSRGDSDEAAPASGPVTAAVAETMMVELPSGLLLEVPIPEATAETMMVELPSGLLLEVPIPEATAETMMVELPSGLLLEVPITETMMVELPSGLLLEVPMVEPAAVVARVRVSDYLPPESTGAVFNYHPAPEVLRIEDYVPPESTGAVYNDVPVRVTEAVPSGSPFDVTSSAEPQHVVVRMLPITARSGAVGDGATVTYLPVTQVRPAVVTPETPVVLNVQPILVE